MVAYSLLDFVVLFASAMKDWLAAAAVVAAVSVAALVLLEQAFVPKHSVSEEVA